MSALFETPYFGIAVTVAWLYVAKKILNRPDSPHALPSAA